MRIIWHLIRLLREHESVITKYHSVHSGLAETVRLWVSEV